MSGTSAGPGSELRVASLALAPVVFASPVAAQQDLVTGAPTVERVAIPALFVLAICSAFVLFLKGFTRRATERIRERPASLALPGLTLLLATGAPIAALVGLTLLFSEFNFVFVAIIAVAALPLLFLLLVGLAIGLLGVGRTLHGNLGIALLLATAFGVAVGLFPPLAIASVVFVVLGVGAFAREWRADSPLEQASDRKPAPWEHRHR